MLYEKKGLHNSFHQKPIVNRH